MHKIIHTRKYTHDHTHGTGAHAEKRFAHVYTICECVHVRSREEIAGGGGGGEGMRGERRRMALFYRNCAFNFSFIREIFDSICILSLTRDIIQVIALRWLERVALLRYRACSYALRIFFDVCFRSVYRTIIR